MIKISAKVDDILSHFEDQVNFNRRIRMFMKNPE